MDGGDPGAATPATVERGRPAWARARVPAYVWWASLAQLCLLLAYAVAVPLYQAPDEPQHVDGVLRLAHGEGWPLGVELDGRVAASRQLAGFDALPLAAGDAPARGARPALAALGGSDATGEANRVTQHPPLYYLLLAGVLRALGPLLGDAGHDTVVGVLRLCSVLFVLPLPLLAFAGCRRVTHRPEAHLAAALAPLAIPQLAHIGSAVNNDNLLVLAFAALTVVLLAALERSRPVLAVVAGLIAGLALLTKGFALLVVPWLAGVYLLAWRRQGRRALAHGALALAVAVVTGGWWWARNLAVHGMLLPRSGALPDYRPEGFDPAIVEWLPYYASRMALRFWGAIGWFSVHLPWWLAWVATAVVLLALVAALVAATRRGWPALARLAVLLFPLAGLLAGTAAASWARYAARASVGGIHGRYLFGGVLGVAVALGLGWSSALRRWPPAAPAVVASLAVALQATALALVLAHYWAGAGLPGTLGAVLAWSPWPPLGALAGALGLAAGAGIVAATRRAARGAPA